MPNFNIWVKNPHPFRYEEYSALAEALRQIYGGQPVYFKEWPVDFVSVDNITLTTARKMADTVKCIHRQAALKDRNFGHYRSSDAPALQADVEVRGQFDGRPDWATSKRNEEEK